MGLPATSNLIGAGAVAVLVGSATLVEKRAEANAPVGTPPNIFVRNLGMIARLGGGAAALGATAVLDSRTIEQWGLEGAALGGLALAIDEGVQKVGDMVLGIATTYSPAPGARRPAGRGPSGRDYRPYDMRQLRAGQPAAMVDPREGFAQRTGLGGFERTGLGR